VAAEGLGRPTPWSVIFAPLTPRYATLGAIPDDPAAFGRTPVVQRLLAEIESPDLLRRAPVAAAEYQYLLFADIQHWRHERPVRTVSRGALDAALSVSPLPSPVSVCYVQLPPRQMWAQPDPDGTHEPLDGCYVIPLPREERLVVAVLGLHAGRAGLSQVTLTVHGDAWLGATDALPDDAFAPAMPGGEAAGFRSVRTAAELLHLVRVALAVGTP